MDPSLSHTNQWGLNISFQGSKPPPFFWSHYILRGIYRHTTSLHYIFYQSILIRSFFPRAVKRPQNQGPGVHKYHNEVYFWNFWPAQIRKRIFSDSTCGIVDRLTSSWKTRITAVCDFTPWIILLYPLYFFGFGKGIISSFLLFFRVYENVILFSSFYFLYLEYNHRVLQTL